MKEYIEISKLRGGPGGWKCSCCNPYNCHPRNMKHLARRVVRRKNKVATKQAPIEE